MWLLNTARAELKFFPTPEGVPGGYVILSHVWGEDEQTFQDLQAIRTRCIEDGTNPRDHVCDKIKNFCILAERSGHEWGWADTCCIDKTSSTELSEAITSMYRYYSLADVCYVYLRDVPNASQGELRAPQSAFRNSRWHKRGWTLQELIAPSSVVFLSDSWELLGAKADLANLLQGITQVPVDVFKLEVSPSAYCVAARMSWAADRETTRPEDEAYCLMGIFGIFMPPLYGEGRNAFLRLQEEIMRQVDDPSIFAWGPTRIFDSGALKFDPLVELDKERLEATALFARSPSDFRAGYLIKRSTGRPRSQKGFLERLKNALFANLSKLPTFTITPYGVMAHLPVFTASGVLIALLWGIELELWGGTARNLALLLREVESPDSTRQLYAPCVFQSWVSRSIRLIDLQKGPRKTAVEMGATLEWRTIYIVRGDPLAMDPSSGLQMVSANLRAPFYFPRSNITAFLRSKGIKSYTLYPPNPTDDSWREHVALTVNISLSLTSATVTLVIYLGLCGKASSDRPQHWAKIVQYSQEPEVDELTEESVEHICDQHHVDEEPRQTHPIIIFGGMQSPIYVRLRGILELSFEYYPLRFTPCRKVNIRFTSIDN